MALEPLARRLTMNTFLVMIYYLFASLNLVQVFECYVILFRSTFSIVRLNPFMDWVQSSNLKTHFLISNLLLYMCFVSYAHGFLNIVWLMWPTCDLQLQLRRIIMDWGSTPLENSFMCLCLFHIFWACNGLMAFRLHELQQGII
jgi:hypothetical protein